MERLSALAPVLAVVAAVCGVAALAGYIWLNRRFERFARPYEELALAAEKEGVSATLQAQLLGVERSQQRIEETVAYAQGVHAQLNTALQGIGILKFDAFEDIRGQQSFSLCLLDAHQDGIILTSIAGRNDYRGYAKPVRNGVCEKKISEEETQALAMAKERLAGLPRASLGATPGTAAGKGRRAASAGGPEAPERSPEAAATV